MSVATVLKNSNSSGGSGLKGLINELFKYDSLIIFGGFGMVILVSIFITVLYEQADSMRHNVLFNNALAVGMG